MRKYFSIIFAIAAITISAQSADTDTIAGKMLGEVVVEAKNASPVADGIEFRPSQREKKTSLDYFGLLEKMQIPVLKVNPSSREITAGDFGCSLNIAPFYRYSKSSQTLNGPNINRSRTDWEVAGGRRIAVSLTYNIGYGRQVSRGNENIVNSLRSSSVR